jgi:putative ABC transport system substrate-binding protein
VALTKHGSTIVFAPAARVHEKAVGLAPRGPVRWELTMKPTAALRLHCSAVFLALLTLAVAAPAQQTSVPRIGWVLSGTAENSRHLIEAMRAGLADEGLVVGRSVELDVRFTEGRPERYAEHFADVIKKPVHVLAASGHAGISAARDASGGRIPVAAYFCGNAVDQMVESFAKPGGNITGVSCLSSELAAKRIELLYDPRIPGKDKELAATRETARKLGMTVTAATASAAENFEDAFAALRRDRAEAVVISEDAFTFAHRARIVAQAAVHQMVDISAYREFVLAGGVMSYGANSVERLRHQARYAARMARGIKPWDLPIDQATRFEFVVSLKAARARGVSIPPRVLLRADEVIE